MGFQRAQVATLIRRLSEKPAFIHALFGPRQTGKTTIVRQALPQLDVAFRYLAVDEPEPEGLDDAQYDVDVRVAPARPARDTWDTRWIVRQWEAARRTAERSDGGAVLVFDEIQKIRRWSEAVKGLWDADRATDCPLHVVILGSSPMGMQAGLSESLAGRFERIPVTHWSFAEMSAAFGVSLPEYLYFGGYPRGAAIRREPDRWRDYVLRSIVEPHVERDLLSMTRVDKPALLKRLFELGTEWSGQILAYNKMLGQLQDAGNTTTLARYLDLLTVAGLLTGLPKYAGRAPRRRGSSPKLQVLNTALMTASSGYSCDEAMADRTFRGRLTESAVGAHLFNTASTVTRLHYWRDGPDEVDFVLQRGPRLLAIEVKSGPRRADRRGRDAFSARFRPGRTLLVGEGGVPFNEFLAVPADHWLDAT